MLLLAHRAFLSIGFGLMAGDPVLTVRDIINFTEN
jgi:hypothetical protein